MKRKSLLVALFLGASLPAQEDKIAPDLRSLLAEELPVARAAGKGAAVLEDNLDVIVVYKDGVNRMPHEKMARRRARLSRDLPSANAATYRIARSQIRALADDPEIAGIHPDRPVEAHIDTTTATTGANVANGLGYTGENIGVAILDSGSPGPTQFKDFWGRNRIVYEQDFTGSALGPRDEFGHGTHVAGILAGRPDTMDGLKVLKNDMKGVAYDAKLVILKVLDKNGAGLDSNVIAAIDRAIALKATYNIRVINLSLGRPVVTSYKNDLLCQAVERAWKAGIVVVVSAGNYGRLNILNNRGYGTITAPGNSPYAITVGAMKAMDTKLVRSDDQLASYSSKGPTMFDWIAKPDIVAPGNRVISVAVPAAVRSASDLSVRYADTNVPGSAVWITLDANPDGKFFRLNGTSMATPAVAGAAAVLLERDPSLTPDQVKARLMKTASKKFPASSTAKDPATGQTFTVYYDMMSVGAGYLDIAAAIVNNDKATGNAQSPATVLSGGKIIVALPAGSTFSLATNVLWGGNVVWGDNSLLGNTVLWGSNVVWGDNVLWGDATPLPLNVLWGDSLRVTANSVLVKGE